MEPKSTKRESVCRICGGRLSFLGPDKDIHWHPGGADDKGLVCESCLPMAKLQRMREDMRKEK